VSANKTSYEAPAIKEVEGSEELVGLSSADPVVVGIVVGGTAAIVAVALK